MKRIHFTKEEKQLAACWVENKAWVEQERYELDQEYLACVREILYSDIFQSMDQFIQHGSTTCKTHCIQVSFLSYRICRRLGWDYREAARAGLLHDFFLYDWHTHAKETGEHFHGYTHPGVALENAALHFELSDREKNMILHHMWPLTPVPPRSKAGFAIVYADKFCGLVEVGSHVKQWFSCSFASRNA